MPRFRVHRVNFFKFQPNAIHCLCYDDSSGLLAVSRADCSIEIWNLRDTPYLERTISPSVGASIESLAWCQGRLFSTGLSAFLLEYDINALKTKHSLSVIGGPAWCLAASKDQRYLATGTEDGFISLFEVEEDGFSFINRFDKQEGRILCMVWHESGKTLATGSIDTIRIWDVERGQTVSRILVSRVERRTETIIWCLAYLRDQTIISGDSFGRVIFWDGRMGVQSSCSRIQKSDILTICVDKTETFMYASGVNPEISTFSRVYGKEGRGGWMKSYNNNMHTHDVRAITMAGKYLVSGGVDNYLVLSTFKPRKEVLKFPPFLQASLVQGAPKARCMLFQYPTSLDLWQVGSTDELEGEDGKLLHLSDDPKHLLQLQTKEGEVVVCSAISEDSAWIAYGTNSSLRLYNFILDSVYRGATVQPTLQRVRLIPRECQQCQALAFTPDGSRLVIATPSGDLKVMATNQILPTVQHTFPALESGERQHLLTCSNDGRFFATATHTGQVIVYSLERKKVACCLPRSRSQATALAFHPHNSNNLLAVYSDQKVVEFDVSRRCFGERSRLLGHLSLDPPWPVLGIAFDPRDPGAILLHDHRAIYYLDPEHTTSPGKAKKERLTEEVHRTPEGQQVKKCLKYRHLLCLLPLQGDEYLAVESSPQQILDGLPPALRRKKFGT